MHDSMASLLTLLALLAFSGGMLPALTAQEDTGGGDVLESQAVSTPGYSRNADAVTEEYKPVGGANVYSYMLFILLGLIVVFLGFRGTRKG